MKRRILFSLIACMMALCACAAGPMQNNRITDVNSSSQDISESTGPAEPIYVFEEVVREKQFTNEESGAVYAYYNYHVPMMRIGNDEQLEETVRETANRNAEAFNLQMQKILDDAVVYGEELAWELEGGWSAMPAADEKILSVTHTGQVITVLAQCYFYGGGAPPYVYTYSYIFDLTLGQFIDPAQIGDDPEAFRTEAAALLVAQAESLGEDYTSGYWDDYAEIISHWNDTTVVFESDGMKVIFSVYELGPYAMGSVELKLTYEALAEAIGEQGLAHLGVK